MQALAGTFGFALQSWQTQPVERNRHHPGRYLEIKVKNKKYIFCILLLSI